MGKTNTCIVDFLPVNLYLFIDVEDKTLITAYYDDEDGAVGGSLINRDALQKINDR